MDGILRPFPGGSVGRCLIVEDDRRVASLHRAFLEAEGIQVVYVAQGFREALEALESLRDLDLVLLDLYLPDGHGLDLLPKLLGIYTIVITAAKDVPTVERALLGGAMDYLVKPFSRGRFQEALVRFRAFVSLNTKREVSQQDLDRILARRRFDKGLDPLTREEVLKVLSASGKPVTAEGVAKALGISRVTAWRYLERLCQEGVVEVRSSYGQPGRPSRMYQLKGSQDNLGSR
ncbi:response regulator [Thermus scotoductus]|uniref:Transcriptional regulatory protein n=1 Tax=Thermus scotoductus TaxID=37636 RepID=A0A430S3W4_THESC|nr:response regulator [Thermus scotoductus]RTH14933.1 response regulator [Thermus scotoductus]RTH28533.1 response regulator [Thermus scotoductus]RTH35979.1 response regulator [Thermus scotoductus]